MAEIVLTKETNQYLTFMLAETIYAIDVAKVREILEVVPITKIPRTPDFMRGVINNRGSVVPVVDMRMKFAMGMTERTVETCIIVIEIGLGGESVVIGALADSVQEVIQLEPSQIEPPPKLGTQIKSDFIRGIGKKDGAFILILDIDKLLTTDELALVQETGDGAVPIPEGSRE